MIKISVAIPAYNVEKFLHAALDSVLAQSYQPHEIIVVNDGSTDRTEEIALSYGDRIRYIRQENQGLSGARNTAIHAATSEWIALFDSDDVMLPDKLARQAAVIEAQPDLVLVYSGFTYLYPDGSTKEVTAFPAKDLWPALRYRTPILPSTTLIRRSALLEVGSFKAVPTEDWHLWFRLIRRYSAKAFRDVPESLLLYRQVENSLSKKHTNLAHGIFAMLDTLLLDGLSGISRALWKRRIEARIYNNLAISLRENKDERFWAFAIESMLRWPFFGRIVPGKRYKVVANMLYRRLRNPRSQFRYWWPVRDCRRELSQGVLPDEPTARGAVTS
jgi:glycosyltransferase involved in cell wall biosynthesis